MRSYPISPQPVPPHALHAASSMALSSSFAARQRSLHSRSWPLHATQPLLTAGARQNAKVVTATIAMTMPHSFSASHRLSSSPKSSSGWKAMVGVGVGALVMVVRLADMLAVWVTGNQDMEVSDGYGIVRSWRFWVVGWELWFFGGRRGSWQLQVNFKRVCQECIIASEPFQRRISTRKGTHHASKSGSQGAKARLRLNVLNRSHQEMWSQGVPWNVCLRNPATNAQR